MEATQKTSATRAALLVIAALSMLLSGLFIATASRSDASPPQACPDGFSLTADGKNCFAAAVVTNVDNPNTCPAGSITPDGLKCYVPARVIPQEGRTLCPKGYSPDDSLKGENGESGMCARFEPASQNDPGCPPGAKGVAGACYIFVAKGPAGTSTCSTGYDLVGDQCRKLGEAPVATEGECPVSATVIERGGSCFTIVTRTPEKTCESPYVVFGTDCKVTNPNAQDPDKAPDWTCPAVSDSSITVTPDPHTVGGIDKIADCTYPKPVGGGECPADSDEIGEECHRSVSIKPGPVQCEGGYSLISNKCYLYDDATAVPASCPKGAYQDTDGHCRQTVADAAGTYYCKDASAALNNKSCVWITGFLIEPAPTQYKCDAGTRTVLGWGDETRVLCFLGNADDNATSGPSCLQGVLSVDNNYCIVPRIDAAPAAATYAPTPSFTG